ncbi:peptidoglycan DD-metalloendopeptidase family protein [Thiomonas sp. FB-6]|uniref:peptidoglycan DD-metalloendopeptidase family protein n=1 Tax=Thiomonas sp. FB-6 TaxID=1158291 RepID=UPI000367FCAE|nr:peptidoglycan DD-metalloendopeptidase family protein [Thiomonas sp. FB-6]
MRLLPAAILLFCATLAGCSTVALNPAPVVSRTATPVASAAQPVPGASAASALASVPLPPGYYRVQRGDTLRSIARSNGQSWQQLAAMNQLSNPNVIEVGQVLRVSPSAPPLAAASGAAVAAPAAAPSAPQVVALAPAGSAAQPPARAAAAASGARREAASAAAPAAARPAPAPSGPATPSAGAHAVAAGLSWSWPAQGRIAQGYNGGTSKGLDIAGKAGEPVRAAAAGKVVYAGNELRGFGNLVIVKHNADYISVYAHNQKLLVHEGEEVRRGQTVALMGSTDAPRVELHFEVRLRGKPIDPTQVLPPR